MNTTTAAPTIGALAVKARAAVTTATAAADRLEAIAAAWPADRPVTMAVDVGQHFAVTAEVATRADAAAYLEAFELEPLAYVKGTFTTVKPLAWFKPEELESAAHSIESDLMPAVWNYGHGRAELRAWPRIEGGGRVQLSVRIAQDPASQAVEYDRPSRIDRSIVWQHLHNAPAGEVIRWSGAGHPCTYTLYFFQEPGGAAQTLADLLSRERGPV